MRAPHDGLRGSYCLCNVVVADSPVKVPYYNLPIGLLQSELNHLCEEHGVKLGRFFTRARVLHVTAVGDFILCFTNGEIEEKAVVTPESGPSCVADCMEATSCYGKVKNISPLVKKPYKGGSGSDSRLIEPPLETLMMKYCGENKRCS